MTKAIRGVALAGFLLAGRVEAMTYFVDVTAGSDTAAGTSPAAAWKTIARVNKGPLANGDHIAFKGGQVHPGNVVLTAQSPGALIFTSYGDRVAVIDAGTGSGIEATGVGALTVSGLEFKGAGRKTGNIDGAGVNLRDCNNAVIERVEAHGFQQSGVRLRDCTESRIERVHAHDNGFAGIHASNCRKLTITRSRAINNPGHPKILNNHSGNGILVSGADILVELCEAAGNGWDQPKGGQGNGPVGIWCHDAERVTIRRCIAHHNMSTSGDGGGFDFDGGTRDSVLEYCYSYQNYSSGYLIWEYGSQHPLARNVIRHCISVNDREGGIRMGKSGGADVTDLDIHHCTIINTKDPCINIQGSWENGKFAPSGGLKDVKIHDNILIGPKGGEIVHGKGNVTFKNNCYWTPDGKPAAPGLDGVHADPKLVDWNVVPQLTDPDRLSDLAPFMPQPDSPAKGLGADITKAFTARQ